MGIEDVERKTILVELSRADGPAVAPEWVLILPAGEAAASVLVRPRLIQVVFPDGPRAS